MFSSSCTRSTLIHTHLMCRSSIYTARGDYLLAHHARCVYDIHNPVIRVSVDFAVSSSSCTCPLKPLLTLDKEVRRREEGRKNGLKMAREEGERENYLLTGVWRPWAVREKKKMKLRRLELYYVCWRHRGGCTSRTSPRVTAVCPIH